MSAEFYEFVGYRLTLPDFVEYFTNLPRLFLRSKRRLTYILLGVCDHLSYRFLDRGKDGRACCPRPLDPCRPEPINCVISMRRIRAITHQRYPTGTKCFPAAVGKWLAFTPSRSSACTCENLYGMKIRFCHFARELGPPSKMRSKNIWHLKSWMK